MMAKNEEESLQSFKLYEIPDAVYQSEDSNGVINETNLMQVPLFYI